MFKKETKFMLFLLLTPIILGLLASIIVPKIMNNNCNNLIYSEISSPNKKNKIVVFTRDCGDKSDYSTQISILRVSEKLDNESGNIFTASTNLGNVLSSNIGSVINSRWVTNDNVVIQYHEKVGVCKNETVYEGIKITYDILK